ncbi:hypothetical protein CCACVL1_24381 [Corchorus capsularis]|uniref:LysM domain-containing protein n=1 Tax=Corchorus capsularis TaxID=210143 RepID=A0A1R3GPZ8_COCAP|nr:hypothetical protein CCACVL1_24381 [Corchorus capsularis]
MQMERERRNSIANGGDYSYNTNGNYSSFCNDYSFLEKEKNQSLPASSLPSVGFIEHPVSRFDTLAGVAIKYGVEVADIKKMNGLVTDLQMFALKTLQIPLPGRHPPSPCLSNGSDIPGRSSANQAPVQNLPPDLLDSFQSLRLTPPRRVSPAMSSLQGYYGLKPTEQKTMSEGFEMAVYRKGEAHYLEDGPFLKPSPSSGRPLQLHRKSRSLANGFFDENGEAVADIMSAVEAKDGEPDKSNDKLIRRRQKSEADFTARTPERLLKEDNTSGGGFSTITGKGLALRSKAASRVNSGADTEVVAINATPTGLGDDYVIDGFSVVRKSSSTSSLQDQENGSLSSLWPASKWSLKPDLQAFSNVAITRPIFDGLPKPMSGRKSKAALD